MIIGRSPAPSGAIKIKKNEQGVPRVVSCGCCCACGSVPVSGELLQILRGINSAAKITCNGVPPDNFSIITGGFSASWSDYEAHGVPNTGMQFVGGCLTLESFLINFLYIGPREIEGLDGMPMSCCQFQGAAPCIDGDDGDIVINGDSFPSFREIVNDFSSPELPGGIIPLNIVFS